jgi:hypothetical protein
MLIENLLTNRIELSKSSQFFFDYQLVRIDIKIDEIIKLEKIGYLVPLFLIDFENINNEPSDSLYLEFKKTCNLINQTSAKENIYILAIKLTKQPISPSSGYNSTEIILDLLGIIMLSLSKRVSVYFDNGKTDSYFSYYGGKRCLFINNSTVKLIEKDNEISKNIESICSLRIEQFRFLQKSLRQYILAARIADIYIGSAIITLITGIENLSSKYGNRDTIEFNHKISFYQKLKKILFRTYKSQLKDSLKESLLRDIGSGYIAVSYTVLAQYQNFMHRFYPPSSKNELTSEFIVDLYHLRSKLVHVAKDLTVDTQESYLSYNIHDRKGELEIFDGWKAKVIRIPSFEYLFRLFNQITLQFTKHLISLKHDENDKHHYKKSDFEMRGIITVTATKQLKQGSPIFEGDYHREIDYIDLDQAKYNITKAQEFFDEEKYQEAILYLEKIKTTSQFSYEYSDFRLCLSLWIYSNYRIGNWFDLIQFYERDKEIIDIWKYSDEMVRRAILIISDCYFKIYFEHEAFILIRDIIEHGSYEEKFDYFQKMASYHFHNNDKEKRKVIIRKIINEILPNTKFQNKDELSNILQKSIEDTDVRSN